jgi:hypothetical protein
MKARRSWPDVI